VAHPPREQLDQIDGLATGDAAERVAEETAAAPGGDRQVDLVQVDHQVRQVEVERPERQVEDLARAGGLERVGRDWLPRDRHAADRPVEHTADQAVGQVGDGHRAAHREGPRLARRRSARHRDGGDARHGLGLSGDRHRCDAPAQRQ
jgi:hypothetical protein